MRFTPTENFYSPELQSDYLVGFFYTVRSPDDLLRKLAAQWLTEGRIRVVQGQFSEVTGS